ncbi:MAG: SpaA isopeptide-forming pilin-related protein [Propioniciclava sp.]|uniref:DUF7927 domain-containing protein n=1 Tax=Propioniciclava sp. TaxID=2038686 RepID=UPI0039E32758
MAEPAPADAGPRAPITINQDAAAPGIAKEDAAEHPAPAADVGALQGISPMALPLVCSPTERRGTERYWFFGNQAGIDFGATGSNPGVAFLGNRNTSEGSTVITDEQGNLQFWSNGQSVFDRHGDVMPNGTGLLGNASATQTVASFPVAGQPGKFFLATTSTDINRSANGRLHYSMVDMTQNNGLGAVTLKNVELGLAGTASEAITAVPNATGDGYWVLTNTNNSPNILAYEFNANGPVTGQPVVSVMPTNNGNRYGTLAFNADYTQLLHLTAAGSGTAGSSSKLRLLSFDAETGAIEQRLEWQMPMGAGTGRHGYAADFSPSGEYVYATKIFDTSRLYRYRIAGATTAAEVKASELYLGTMGSQGGQVRRAPDGRMYVANTGGTALSLVTDPDAATPTYAQNGFPLPAGAASQGGLPQMVTGCPPVTRSLRVTKQTTATSASRLGDTVSYTVSVRNTGAGAYNSAVPAHVVDDLSEVLDESTWVGASAKLASDPTGPDVGTLTFDPTTKRLRWSGTLAVDATVDITYTITIGDDLDGVLRNIAWVPEDPAHPLKPDSCAAGDDSCAETVTRMPTQALVCAVDPRRATERFWYFGGQAGIDFGAAGTSAQAFTGNRIANEGSTVVTDVEGNLQFWSNGQQVFDRNGDLMQNGDGLTGNASATQTVASFPMPGHPGRFGLVTTSTDVNQTAKNSQLRYSVVDMTLNNGLGAVTSQKNVPLGPVNSASEAITAAPNATGDGYWVLTYTNGSPNVLAYEFNADGPVTGQPVVSVMPTSNGNRYGTLAFNAGYSQLVQLTSSGTLATPGSTTVRMLHFNAATGKIRQRYAWQLPTGANTGRHGYNAEFSPAGDYVYATKIFDTGRLYRYRVAGATTEAEVKATEQLVGPIGGYGGQVRRAPDGRMYVADNGGSALSIVRSPDAADPQHVAGGFALPSGADSRFGLPQTVTGCPPVTPSVRIDKQTTAASVIRPRDTASYTITATNNGSAAYTAGHPARLLDDLSDVVDDATFDGAAHATIDGVPVAAPTWDAASKRLAWSGPLAIGKSVVITYQVRVNRVSDTAIRTLKNVAWAPKDPGNPSLPATCEAPVPGQPASTGAGEPCALTITQLPPPPPSFLDSCRATTFDTNTEGWMVRSTTNGKADYTARRPATWRANDGFPGGAIYTGDLDGQWTEFVSPNLATSGYATDYGHLIGTSFGYDYRYVPQSNGQLYPMYVTLESTTGEWLWTPVTDQVRGARQWTRVNVELDHTKWRRLTSMSSRSGPSGAPATAEEFARVLGNLKQIYFGAEGVYGSEDSFLDNFGTLCNPQLNLAKTSTATADSRPGDTVTYSVIAGNTSAGDFTLTNPGHVMDDLTGVLDDASFSGELRAVVVDANGAPVLENGHPVTRGTVTFDPATKRIHWTGALMRRERVRISYDVTIGQLADGALRNFAWIPEDPATPDKPTACAAGDDSCAETETLLPRLEVTKTADVTGVPATGQQVTYTITVTNRGPGVYTGTAPASLTDDMSAVLDKATFAPATITVTSGATEFDPGQQRLSWRGALGLDESAVLRYTVTYTGANAAGERTLFNQVCADGRGMLPGRPSCAPVSVPAADLEHWKTVSPSADPVLAGTTVTYQLHFRNMGDVPATVNMVDHLSGVLDDADMLGDPLAPAVLTVTQAGNRISVTGSLPADGVLYTVEYRVELKPDGQRGDGVAVNFLLNNGEVPPIDGCQPSPRLPNCTSTTVAAHLEVQKRGQSPDGPQPVAGAEFAVFPDDGGQAADSPLTSPALTPGDTAGLFRLTGIPVGSYWLREVRAPQGHSLLAEDVPFEITSSGAVLVHGNHPQVTVSDENGIWRITVTDAEALRLPLSGGAGRLTWAVGALILLLGTGLIGILRRASARTRASGSPR